MRSSTGRWVSGDNFFDRERELRILEERVRAGNHVLLTGQRRMGKTSIARELGRRLTESGEWITLFTDVEDATCPEDVIADVARAAYPVLPIRSLLGRMVGAAQRAVGAVEEVEVSDVRLKIRAGLDAGNWRGQGERLLRGCAEHDTRILLVIDELPIFLKRMLRTHDGADRVERFLSWLRGVFQSLGGDSPVLIVSGSIGLTPLVHRLGIPDRINYLEPFRLGPWNREASVACFDRLANSAALAVEDGVAGAVYDALGIGIPHHVQSFFARLRDYETRLRDALDEESRSIAMEILADAATQGVLTAGARIRLGELYSRVVDDAHARITEILDVLIHDGYLEVHGRDHRFPSRLLRDWWAARFRDHHVPITSRSPDAPEGRVQ